MSVKPQRIGQGRRNRNPRTQVPECWLYETNTYLSYFALVYSLLHIAVELVHYRMLSKWLESHLWFSFAASWAADLVPLLCWNWSRCETDVPLYC